MGKGERITAPLALQPVFLWSTPPFNGGGYNPGFTSNAESTTATGEETANQNDGFVSPSRKGTIKAALRGTPTPPPKKARWSTNFKILGEENEEPEEKEDAEEIQEGTGINKSIEAKKHNGNKSKCTEKYDEEVEELAKEID